MSLGAIFKILGGIYTLREGLRGLSESLDGLSLESPVKPAKALPPARVEVQEKPRGEWDMQSTTSFVGDIDGRVAKIIRLVRKGKRSPKIQLAVAKVLNRKCGSKWCIAEKDHLQEIKAIFQFVRGQARYLADPRGVDTYRAPERTLFDFHGGDCFMGGTLVLRDDYQLVPVEALRVGDKIWGHTRWSTVTATWDRGVRSTWTVVLNNGGSIRLTPEHKVWLDDTGPRRVAVSDLKPGDRVIQPTRIPFGNGDMDTRRARIEGLYLADGWTDGKVPDRPSRFSIAAKDGFRKATNKDYVEAYCEEHGIKCRRAIRYISVNDARWATELKRNGSKAWLKRATTINLSEGPALALLDGILADSGMNHDGASRTFTTTSRDLFLQARVLAKMAGITCGQYYLADHGGVGTHPIWRLNLRATRRSDGKGPKALAVKRVIRDNQEAHCYDFATDDHMVWLPEVDWTTSQCDDLSGALSTLLAIALEACGFETRLRVIAVKPNPADAYSHILVLVGLPQRNPTKWMALDPSVNKPAGWYPRDKVSGFKDYVVPP